MPHTATILTVDDNDALRYSLTRTLRGEGYKVANNRLRWLAAVSGLEAGQDGEPDTRASGGR